MPPTLERLRRHVGEPLPTGTHTLAGYEHWLATDAVGVRGWSAGTAHPLAAFWATLAGLGVSLDELFALFDATAADGVMVGETDLRLGRPLRVGEDLRIQAVVRDVQRKHGARAGTFDLVALHLDVVGADGAVAATVDQLFVFPRRDEEGS